MSLVLGGISAGIAGLNALIAGSQALKKQDAVGVTPEQEQTLGISMHNLSRMQAQRGLGASEVQKIQQLGQETMAQSLQQIQSLRSLSAYDKQRLSKRIQEQTSAMTQSIADKIQMLDIGAEAKRLESVAKASALASTQASQMQQAEYLKKQTEIRNKQIAVQAFTNMLGAGAAAVTKSFGNKKPDATTPTTAGREPVAAPQTGTPTLNEAGTGIAFPNQVNYDFNFDMGQGDVIQPDQMVSDPIQPWAYQNASNNISYDTMGNLRQGIDKEFMNLNIFGGS